MLAVFIKVCFAISSIHRGRSSDADCAGAYMTNGTGLGAAQGVSLRIIELSNSPSDMRLHNQHRLCLGTIQRL